MSRAWSAIRWTLDKLLRLAATATALIAIPFALIGGPMIDRPATTLSLIAGLSITVFGFLLALSLLIASAYLDEFVFRFNRRSSTSRGMLFYRLLQQAVVTDPVTYQDIVHPDLERGKAA